MARSGGHAQIPAPGTSEKIYLLEAKMCAESFEVIDLIGECARLAGFARRGAAVAALIEKMMRRLFPSVSHAVEV